jgi:hypothetical protein
MSELMRFAVLGSPPPWSVTAVDKFVVSSLQRAQREGGALPQQFRMTMCPWGERNAMGETRGVVQAVIDPRLRIVHFTGCSRPYLVVLFVGKEAARYQEVMMRCLPWSEHYDVELDGQGTISLRFVGCTEEPEEENAGKQQTRNLQELFRSGALTDF